MRDISKRLTVINTEKKDNASDSKGQSSGVTYVGFGGGGVRNLNDYLLKSIWDRVWEIRTDSQGTEYIFGKLPVVTQYGITMYSGENIDIPTIAEGLPFDEKTIWFNPSTKQIEVIGGIGGGATTLGSLTNVGSWADSVASQDRIMYQAANSSQWVAKNLSDLAVGGVTGNYLPLSGGTLTNTLTIDNSDVGLILHRSGQATPYIRFGQDTNNEWGELGVYNDGRLVFWSLVSSQGGYNQWNTVWHAGNDGSGSGLDADLLDGLDATAFFYDKGASNSFDDKIYNGAYRTSSFKPNNAYGYGLVASFRSMETCAQIYFPDRNGEPQFRMQWNSQTSITSSWTALITSSSIGNYNAGSATKLATPRTIWGQSFDGTGNVSGTLSGVYDIDFASKGNYVVGTFDKNANTVYTNNIHSGKGNNLWLKSTADTYITNSDGTTKLLTILSTGNVGIGTDNPSSYKFEVVGETFLRGGLTLKRSSDNSNSFYIGQTPAASTTMLIQNGSGGGKIHIRTNSGGSFVDSVVIAGYTTTINNNLLTTGGVTMYSDIRKKTILNHVELSLKEIANAPLIEHYYNSDQNKTTHVGSIAQYWAEMNDWFCKEDDEGYYTMEIQNAALASAISVARELVRFETETDRRIRLLEEENKRLKEEVEQLKWNIA